MNNRYAPLVVLFWVLCTCIQDGGANPLPIGTIQHSTLKRSLAELSLRSWDSDRGLPNNSVMSIGRTSDGMLWVGTWEGLTRFDGSRFRHFNRFNTPEINADGIRALTPTSSGGLWVGTSAGGLLRIEDNHVDPVLTQGTLPNRQVISLLESDDSLWIGLEGGGLYRLRLATEELSVQGRPMIASNDSVHSLFESADSGILASTRDRLWRISDQGVRLEEISLPGYGAGMTLSGVLESAAGTLWLATSKGVFRRSDARADWDRLTTDAVYRIAFGEHGELWAGTVTRGLLRIVGDSVDQLARIPDAPDGFISALLPEADGGAWFGTNGGLNRLEPMVFRTVSVDQGLSNDYVRSFAQTPDRRAWVATAGGLNVLTPGDGSAPSLDASMGSTAIFSLETAQDGSLWVGTYTEGIFVLKDGEKTVPENLQLPATMGIRSMLAARDGTMWIGTMKWVVHYDPKTQTTLPTPQGRYSTVFALHEDRAGRIWVATIEGLARIDGDAVRYFGPEDGYEATTAFAIHEALDGAVWVATDSGLVRHFNDRFARVGPKQGLPFHTVLGIAQDDADRFWLSSRIGVYRVAQTELEAAMDDLNYTMKGQFFNRDDGMGSAQSTATTSPTVLRMANGEIWFATAKGVSIVRPEDSVQKETKPLNVVIDKVSIDEQDVDHRVMHALDPGRHSVVIQFASVALLGGGEVEHAYRVSGLEDQWEFIGADRTVRLSNLAPGKYTVDVAARMGVGPLIQAPTNVAFSIAPRFWQMRGFLPFSLTVAGLLVFGLHRARQAALRMQNKSLEIEVAARTGELRQVNKELRVEVDERVAAERALRHRNDELASLNQKLASAQSQLLQSEKMASVGQLAAGVAHEINNPLGYVRGNLQSLKKYCDSFLAVFRAYETYEAGIDSGADAAQELQAVKQHFDIKYLLADTPALFSESMEGVDRIAKIVDTLKRFSRIDDTDWKLINIHDALDATLGVLEHTLSDQILVRKEFDTVPLVACLPFQINQVFLNVLMNAAQSIEGSGQIIVRCGTEDGHVWIGIEDSGCGIEPDHLPRIFEPFFTTHAVGSGTGLGLSVAYDIVQKHGGSIGVESTVGHGSRFTICLPISANPENPLCQV